LMRLGVIAPEPPAVVHKAFTVAPGG
jgi:hypothetical protein